MKSQSPALFSALRPHITAPRMLRALVFGTAFAAAAGVATATHAGGPLAKSAAEPYNAQCQYDAEAGLPSILVVDGFDVDSAALTVEDEADVIDYAKEIAHLAQVCVVGQADKRGTSAYNDRLAMKRARAVAARLIGAGVDPAVLSLSSRGEALFDALPDWFWGSGSRRVEIIAVR